MKTTKKTQITIESERQLVLTHGSSFYGLCSACGDEVCMVTVAEAAALAKVSWRQIFRAVEADEVHFLETAAGALFICCNSLNHSSLKLKN